jgi:ATP-dependent helicase/nuclease subunit B
MKSRRMPPLSSNVRRHFLPWDRPLPPQAAEFLAAGRDRTGPIDLSKLLVVVPTRQSGRRLREALAELAAAHGQAVFPPRVLTPDALIAPGASPEAASRAVSLLAWVEVFRGLDLAAFREVFSADPPARNFSWALRLARTFSGLQATLAEVRLRLADVPGKMGGDFPEAARWRQLGEIEARYLEQLARIGRTDAQAARIAAALNPPPPPGIEKIILLAVPDPIPLALDLVAAHARAVPVEVLVFAPAAEADGFDGWGRPVGPYWASRILDLPDFEHCVRLCADPAAQAERIVELAGGHAQPDGLLGVGAADSAVLPFLESALAQAGIPSFNPEGVPRRREGMYQLLSAFAALAKEPDFGAIEALARCPDFLEFLGGRLGGAFSVSSWLEGLDDLHARHLPADLAAARAQAVDSKKFPDLVPALDCVAELRAMLIAGGFAAGGSAALGQVFAARRLDLDRPADARFEDSAAAWTSLVRECASAAGHFPGLADADGWNLALELFADSQRADDKPDGALELQGWLELLFEDAPHLAVAGCNDGSMPGAVTGDPFLPERMRARLGLKTNGERFARDAYVLQAITACRKATGRIELLVGKVSAEGDPLRPSRLLFRCADAELPRRVEFLFRPAGKARPSPPWQRAWCLRPEIVDGRRFETLRATAFRDYLRCPFRFYLTHAMGIRPFDSQKAELDSLDFGTLCHAALEAMGNERGLRDCMDAATLREFLTARLDAFARDRYGARLPVPLIIQFESARQRLAKAAEVQASQRAQGWVIEQTEKAVRTEIGGVTVTGTIDRIDRHEKTGSLRVLDYKTSDQSTSPLKAHAGGSRGDEAAPAFAQFSLAGKPMVWIDLQLPIYWEAVRNECDAPSVAAGYFNLPKATGETRLEFWDGYGPELHAAAMRCAEGVVAAVAAGVFWPPAETGERDEFDGFGGLFHHGAADSVDPEFAEEVRRP